MIKEEKIDRIKESESDEYHPLKNPKKDKKERNIEDKKCQEWKSSKKM